MATNTDTRNPAEIEREIRRTQYQMSDTADRLGEQLKPSTIASNLLDKGTNKMKDSGNRALEATRSNPIPLAMIGIGGLWLAARTKPQTSSNSTSYTPAHDNHRAYVEHMSMIEPRADEDDALYQRRRDCARATFLLIERMPEEDESSWRGRLDSATTSMRDSRDSMMAGLRSAGDSTRQTASDMGSRAASTYRQNPLVGGLIAAVVGAIAGSAVPVSRTEEEKLGQLGSDAIDMAKDKAKQAGEMAREKKDELVDKADQKMSKSSSSGQSGSLSGEGARMPNPQYDTV